jgi:geranylgeranylglycerol-phosphate geranylgeranyltransferase
MVPTLSYFNGKNKIIRTMYNIARLTRAPGSATAGLGVVVGVFLTDPPLPTETIFVMVLVVFTITAAGFAINDVFDQDIDRINRSKRPIPSGEITTDQAKIVSVVLYAIGIGSSFLLSPWCIAIAVANSIILTLYAKKSKRIGIGKDLTTGYLVGSVFIFGTYSYDRLNMTIVALACCSALATFARDIVKDIEDTEGDRRHGAATLPIVVGARKSYVIAFTALGAAILLSFLPYALGRMNDLFLVINIVGCVILGGSKFAGSAQKTQRLIMLGSVVELIAFLVGPN